MVKEKKKTKKRVKILRVLFVGDIVGESGRKKVKKLLPGLVKKHRVDVVIANGEHLSERVGLDITYVREMEKAGVGLFTTGNHVMRQKEFEEHMGKSDVPVIRPANFIEKTPGQGFRIVKTKKGKLLVINLLGKEDIPADVSSPFKMAKKIIEREKDYDFLLCDFHAEMTSEKVAMGYFLDGKASAVIGTHTHVPTADARILPGGTAYISDVGMTGPKDSVLGVKSDIIIDRFIDGKPQKFEVAEGPAVFNSVLLELTGKNKAKSIKRIDELK